MLQGILGALGAVTLAVAAYTAGVSAGRDHVRSEWEKSRADTSAANAKHYADAVAAVGRIENDRSNQMAVLRDDYDAILSSLRARPSRPTNMPVTSNDQSKPGATGSQLYAEDAGFLAREAADADTTRIALTACYSQYDAAVGVK